MSTNASKPAPICCNCFGVIGSLFKAYSTPKQQHVLVDKWSEPAVVSLEGATAVDGTGSRVYLLAGTQKGLSKWQRGSRRGSVV
jgi:hypothetical protein